MGNMKELFKKYTLLEKVLCIVLLLCFFAQFFWICYINLFQIQYHLGYDASAYLLKSIEMAKQGSLFVEHWSDQTSLYLDSPVPFAALVYKMTNNIFFSYGIVNILMLGVLLLLFWRLMSCFICKTNLVAKLFAINLVISAFYLTGASTVNDLQYSSMMYVGAAMYIFKIITFLLVILCVIRLEEGQRYYISCTVSLIMLFVTGLSSGTYMLFTCLVPCLVYVMVKVLLTNKWNSMKYSSLIYLILGTFLSIGGKISVSMISGFDARDAAMTWCGYGDFWRNFGLFLMGYPQEITAMSPTSTIEIMSLDGIFMVCGIGILLVTVAALVFFARKVYLEKGRKYESLLLLIVIAVNVCVFVFGYTLYEDVPDLFQSRYLIPLMMIYFICIGIWMDHLNKRYIISNLIMLATALCILGMNIKSDVEYTTARMNYDELKELTEVVKKETEAPVVYVLGDEIESRNLRVIDTSKVYKTVDENGDFPHWGDYLYYDNPEEYPGEVLVLSKNNALQNLETYYEVCELLTTYKEYEIYKMKNNIMGRYCPMLEMGQPYTFSGDIRTAEGAVIEGLSYNEGAFSWTDGNLKMRFGLKKTESLSQNASIRFGLQGVWGLAQHVKVKINGKTVLKTKLDATSTTMQIDFEIPDDRIIEMEIVLPDANSPNAAGINEDMRILGLRMVDMQVDLKQ